MPWTAPASLLYSTTHEKGRSLPVLDIWFLCSAGYTGTLSSSSQFSVPHKPCSTSRQQETLNIYCSVKKTSLFKEKLRYFTICQSYHIARWSTRYWRTKTCSRLGKLVYLSICSSRVVSGYQNVRAWGRHRTFKFIYMFFYMVNYLARKLFNSLLNG